MSSKQKIAIVISLVVTLILIGGGIGVFSMIKERKAEAKRQLRATPEYARDQIFGEMEDRQPDEVEQFMSPKGKRVLLHFAQEAQKNAPAGGSANDRDKQPAPRPSGDPQMRGDYCNFPYKVETVEFYMSFRKSDPSLGLNDGLGVYQFDDMVFTKIKERKIDDLSMAWAIDHPIQAALKLTDWKAMGDSLVSTIQAILSALTGSHAPPKEEFDTRTTL